MVRKRLDILLVEKGLFPTRRQAQIAIRSGWVRADGQPAGKPGKTYREETELAAKQQPPYVGRGGEKLKGALEHFQIKAEGIVALDVGSSTGGFTDCLLQEGARRVYCLDVGRGQLAWKLRKDERVELREGFNARYLKPSDLPEKVDLAVVDVSFISLTKILPSVREVLKAGGRILALIKPQFEAARGQVGRGGVVRDEAVHREVISRVSNFAAGLEMESLGVVESVLIGPAGNREFFILLKFFQEKILK